MNRKKFLFPSLAVCAMLALIHRLFARGSTRPVSVRPVSNHVSYEAIDAYVEGQMHRLNLPGVSLAILEGDRIVHLRGFGLARPGGETPTPQTPFFIGSVTKSFTALAVMQLVEAGKVELDCPVQHYLPWFRLADPLASAQITVRHLLNQTSGLPSAPGWATLAVIDDRPGAIERQVRGLSGLRPARPAGSAFEYNNANFNILGLIIEAASGEAYADYIQTHIFNPLGMSHSYTSKTAAKRDGLATGHRFWFWRPIAEPDLRVPQGDLPAGMLISCAEDLARYLIAQLNGGRYGEAQVLSPAGMDEMHRGAAEFNAMGVSLGKYGMGWFVVEAGQTKIIHHGGQVPDFSAFVALLPEQKRGVVLLANAGHFWMDPIMGGFGFDVATLLAGQQPEPDPLSFVRYTPWVMRLLPLIPLLQILGVIATLRRVNRWQKDPQRRPSRGRMWRQHILLPLIPNLSFAALPVLLRSSALYGFLSLYMPDLTWIAWICGGFAGIWSFLRTGLILRALRKAGR